MIFFDAVNQYEDKVKEHGSPHDKARITTEVLQVLGFIAFRQRTRDKFNDITFRTLVIVQLCVIQKTILC